MPRALVLSGGGSNGAWEVGALKWLIGVLDRDFDILTGTSVGALNAGFLAQFGDLKMGVAELEKMWLGLKGTSDIYKPWLPLLGKWGGLFGKPSWYDSRPLWKLAEKYFDASKVAGTGRRLVVGAVSYRTGELRRWNERSPDLRLALLASSAFPAFFCPVEIDGDLWTDAGLREIIPVQDAVDADATDITVITSSPPSGFGHVLSAHPKAIELSQRCIDIMSNEVVRGDLAACEKKGLIVERLSPVENLGDSLDFSPDKNRKLLDLGYTAAQAKWLAPDARVA